MMNLKTEKPPLILAGPWNIDTYKFNSDVIDLGLAPMPAISETIYYWGTAQKLFEDIWRGVEIDTAIADAQEIYELLARLSNS